MEIAERLRSLRKARGITQEELANALFVTRQSVYKWETGKALPDVDKLRQLCVFFEISADELLGIAPPDPQISDPWAADIRPDEAVPMETDSLSEADPPEPEDVSDASVQSEPAQRGQLPRRWKAILLVVLTLTIACLLAAWLPTLLPPQEVRAAQADGMLPAPWIRLSEPSVSERDFLQLLCATAALRLGGDSSALKAAYEAASGERVTREKAAYWLYCAHVWVMIDPGVKLEYDQETPSLSARDQWQDMNRLGRAFTDSLAAPWEERLCTELAETGALFDQYDGTEEMDAQINAILDGRCYSSVAFCLAQRSFLTEKPILEAEGGSFRPKERISARDAVVAARRLYESW